MVIGSGYTPVFGHIRVVERIYERCIHTPLATGQIAHKYFKNSCGPRGESHRRWLIALRSKPLSDSRVRRFIGGRRDWTIWSYWSAGRRKLSGGGGPEWVNVS